MSENNDHTPDASRPPDCVAGWTAIKPDQVFFNGEQWLMAVPIGRHESCNKSWGYEFAVVTIRCDEGYFAMELEDQLWGWRLKDVGFGVRLRGGS